MDTRICWETSECCEEMNRALEQFKKDNPNLLHLAVFKELLDATDEKGSNLLDIGCGTGMISEFCNGYNYQGADLPHILAGCAMKNYPEYYYKATDIVESNLSWINKFPVVVLNGIIDVMENPLIIFDKILKSASKFIVLHRQEISQSGPTTSILNASYNAQTFHSIINQKDFEKILDDNNFDIVKQLSCGFGNWEDGGTSFLLRKRKTWALYEMDCKLNKLFNGKRDGVAIEAGANDGLTQSNTMYLEFYKNWKCLLIEPIKEVFDKLKENRSSNSIFENCALVSNSFEGYEIQMLHTPRCHGLMSCIDIGNYHDLAKKTAEIPYISTAIAKTLNQLLEKHQLGKIDILILDCEGAEINILRGLNFSKWDIEYLLIEELVEGPGISNAIAEYYEFQEKLSDHDYLYKKRR